MNNIKIKAYGKVNLSLDVTGVRNDGYHVIRTVMQKISLHDDVDVTWTPSKTDKIEISLDCNRPYLPKDSRNLAYQAAVIMGDSFGEKAGGGKIQINIEKRLPVAAGLAGGSGYGAAVIIALNKLWKLGLNTRQLCRISSDIGADVPFCILTQNTRYGCALCEGTGTELTPLRSKMRKGILLVKPSFGVSTREVYKGIDKCIISQRPDTEALVKGLKEINEQLIYENMVNVLEEYTLDKYDEVKCLKEKIKTETNAEKVLMTGSGPTVFGLFAGVSEAQKACAAMRAGGYEAYWATTL